MITKGELLPKDNGSYIPIDFDVPEGTTKIHIEFDHNPKHTEGQPLPQQISLSIFDPTGIRGEYSRPNAEGLTVGLTEATLGTLAGEIQAGTWTLLMAVHRIMPAVPVSYEVKITLSSEEPSKRAKEWPNPVVSGKGAGWYRGDLHAHSFHSDGSWSITDLIAYAKEKGMDFVTLSDHNTISGLAEHRSYGSEDFVTLGGTELSTFRGHAVALGVQEWFEWRKKDGSVLSVPDLIHNVLAGGAFAVIAHPRDEGDPVCCGCRWEHEDMMPGNVPAVEIWNGIWAERNEEALQLFYSWLNEGHKLVATSGTDMHSRPKDNARGAVNCVYAESFTEKGILAALKQGHSYITGGPELLLDAESQSGERGMMGDSLANETTRLTISWRNVSPATKMRLIVDGKVYKESSCQDKSNVIWSLLANQGKWCTAELRDDNNELWAVTNPIFFH